MAAGRCFRVRLAAASVAASFALAACTSPPPPPEVRDPLEEASPRSTLPSNVGPAECSPPSETREIDLGLEVEAASQSGEIWALFENERQVRSGEDLEVWWRIPGTSALTLVLVADDRELEIEDERPDPSLGWARPGDQWVSTVRFPQPGCWRISATRGTIHGDVWLRVQ